METLNIYRFENDYSEGCLEEILNKLYETNMDQTPGYRMDDYCLLAEKKIQSACKKDVDVHFLVGGTQVNMTVLDAVLRPHQGVISPILGHINVHEVGAIEGRGHKVLAISANDEKLDRESKLSAKAIEEYLYDFFESGDWHKVAPGAVYISHPTERGGLYTKQEIIDIKKVCDKYEIPLFLDGARLSYALASKENELTLEDIAIHTDIFYIGGTKCGAMFGEAVCFTNDRYNKDFRCISKHNGAVLAKGRLLGLQFETLFTDNMYTKKSIKAYEYAMRLKKAFIESGFEFYADSYTNQQFPILKIKDIEYLRKEGFTFNIEKKIDENTRVVRFCTSWATKEESIVQLENTIKKMINSGEQLKLEL